MSTTGSDVSAVAAAPKGEQVLGSGSSSRHTDTNSSEFRSVTATSATSTTTTHAGTSDMAHVDESRRVSGGGNVKSDGAASAVTVSRATLGGHDSDGAGGSDGGGSGGGDEGDAISFAGKDSGDAVGQGNEKGVRGAGSTGGGGDYDAEAAEASKSEVPQDGGQKLPPLQGLVLEDGDTRASSSPQVADEVLQHTEANGDRAGNSGGRRGWLRRKVWGGLGRGRRSKHGQPPPHQKQQPPSLLIEDDVHTAPMTGTPTSGVYMSRGDTRGSAFMDSVVDVVDAEEPGRVHDEGEEEASGIRMRAGFRARWRRRWKRLFGGGDGGDVGEKNSDGCEERSSRKNTRQ